MGLKTECAIVYKTYHSQPGMPMRFCKVIQQTPESHAGSQGREPLVVRSV